MDYLTQMTFVVFKKNLMPLQNVVTEVLSTNNLASTNATGRDHKRNI